MQKGWEVRKDNRIQITKIIKEKAISEINQINSQSLFLIGTMLYWAEEAKDKEYRPGINVMFSNSDPKMIQLFLKWLKEIINIPDSRIKLEIYLHITHKNQVVEIRKYWSEKTGFPTSKFDKIYFK